MSCIYNKELSLHNNQTTEVRAHDLSEVNKDGYSISIVRRSISNIDSDGVGSVEATDQIIFSEAEAAQVIEAIHGARQAIERAKGYISVIDEVRAYQVKSPQWESVNYDSETNTLVMRGMLRNITVRVYINEHQQVTVNANSPLIDSVRGSENINAPTLDVINTGITMAYSSVSNAINETNRLANA